MTDHRMASPPEDPRPTLVVSHLTKRFGSGATEVVAVREVSLEVAPGEVVLIMRLLRSIAKEQGRSIVIVSHDQRIKGIADRVLWLEDGTFTRATEMAGDPSELIIV